MTPAVALEALRRAYDEREKEARARHAAGQKVVGYFSANVPEELILAAGAFPVRLSGNPGDTTALGDLYMEDFFDGDIRSIFDRVLRGHFNFVDLLVIPRTSEGLLQFYYFLQETSRWEPDRKFPPLYLFDLLQTNNWLTGRYVYGRMVDFKSRLESLVSAPIAEAAVFDAIGLTNQNRRLVLRMDEARREGKLAGPDMLRIMGASWFMDKSDHSHHLEAFLAGAGAPLAAAPRVMVKGSPLDHDCFYALVKDCGGHVVAEDHGWGIRNFSHLVRDDLETLEGLTEHYHLYSPSPRQFPQARQDAAFLKLAGDACVEGVIFYLEEHDDTLGWDYPAQKAALDAVNIPSLYLKRQSYRHPDTVAQRAAVSDFLASLGSARP